MDKNTETCHLVVDKNPDKIPEKYIEEMPRDQGANCINNSRHIMVTVGFSCCLTGNYACIWQHNQYLN